VVADAGLTLRYTDHDRPIQFDESDDASGSVQEYTPFYGWDVSARQLQSGLAEANLDTFGIISSAQVTHSDLRAGRYDNGAVTEFLVDWRVPHRGAVRKRTYSIGGIRFTGEFWIAELNGLPNRLQNRIGAIFTRNCGYTLGVDRCPVIIGSFDVEEVRVVAASQDATEPKRKFQATIGDLPTQVDDYYKYGTITWTTGLNSVIAHVSTCKVYSDTARDIELYENTPFDIGDNDKFTIVAGCDKLFST